MKELFITKSVEMKASASKVWKALTNRKYTDQWMPAFSEDDPVVIESDWEFESPVLWKNKKGDVIVDGIVTLSKPERQLRFTVQATDEAPSGEPPTSIEYTLKSKSDKTLLTIKQVDFAKITGGKEHHDYMLEVWDHILAKIKTVADA